MTSGLDSKRGEPLEVKLSFITKKADIVPIPPSLLSLVQKSGIQMEVRICKLQKLNVMLFISQSILSLLFAETIMFSWENMKSSSSYG